MAKGPTYYQRGTINVWDFIRDQGLNFHLGNAIKYICRAGYKDSKIKDLEKAIHYLENELHMKKTFLSDQAKEFRSKYGIQNSISRESRARQKELIVEEFKEFLEADGKL